MSFNKGIVNGFLKRSLNNLDIYEIIKRILIIVIFCDIYSKYKSNVYNLSFILILFIILILNDYLRISNFYKNRRSYVISYIFSTIILSILIVCVGGNTYMYYYYSIGEIFYCYNKNRKPLLIFHFSLYIISIMIHIFIRYGANVLYKAMFLDVLILCFWYLSNAGMIYYMKKQSDEKQKVKKLNYELEEANNKLEKYSKEVQSLTIKNERNRMASEMHDSLGHSLTALIMQLEFVDKIIENNPQKAKEILNKSQNLARESMMELRNTVYSLKENSEDGFIESINKLISNIIVTDNIQIHFKYSENVENLLPYVENILYRTIKESITNSIKHGQATEINIEITDQNNQIHIKLKDNGLGCEQITYGNGIKGIIDRIDEVGGEVALTTLPNKGFRMDISIPREMEMIL